MGTVAGAVADLPAASLQPLIAVCEGLSLALQVRFSGIPYTQPR